MEELLLVIVAIATQFGDLETEDSTNAEKRLTPGWVLAADISSGRLSHSAFNWSELLRNGSVVCSAGLRSHMSLLYQR